jgi:hypothetical protein
VFPDPVDAFCGLVPKIPAIEVAAQEQDEFDAISAGLLQLGDFGGFLLGAFVRVREVAC